MLRARLATLRALALLSLPAAACDSQRDRPTGSDAPLPEIDIEVSFPAANAWVPADSVIGVLVQATGGVRTVEFMLTRVSPPDTLASGQQQFLEVQDDVQVEFQVYVPPLETGVYLEIRGLAQDELGGRHESAPVLVMVVECERFPSICEQS